MGKIIFGGQTMAPAFDTSKMSPDEFKFIRTYCGAVRSDYHAITAAIALTDPAELGLTCPFSAAKIAFGLQGMHREYSHKFAEIGVKHVPEKSLENCLPVLLPSLDDIGKIFTMSFFKIVDSATQKAIVTPANKVPHDGWSSGRPSDWQHSLKSLYEIQKQKNPAAELSLVFNKLFSIFMGYKFSGAVGLPPPDAQEEEYDPYDDYYDDDEDDDYYFK